MSTDRITRIKEMEEIYDRVRKELAALKEYEESGLWLQDYEADERGEIPRDLKRGVLSQDGLDEVFDEAEELGLKRRRYPVVTLCGSTRFREQFMEAQKRLTLEGNIVSAWGFSATAATMRCGRRAQRRCSTTCTSAKSTWPTAST